MINLTDAFKNGTITKVSVVIKTRVNDIGENVVDLDFTNEDSNPIGSFSCTPTQLLHNLRTAWNTDHPDDDSRPETDDDYEADNCVRCGNAIDHNDPHLYCSNCG